jgi:hypothetical protein
MLRPLMALIVSQLEPLAARAFLFDFIANFPGQVFCFDN